MRMKKALHVSKAIASWLVTFLVSAALWIVSLFFLGAASIVAGVNLILGPGAALIATGISLLCACYLLKKAVING
ncbi:hypothetical protein N0406_03550 [Pseudomonas aeruginosa]|nr:hypothetical protein [Pseudomonas aeruginosa]